MLIDSCTKLFYSLSKRLNKSQVEEVSSVTSIRRPKQPQSPHAEETFSGMESKTQREYSVTSKPTVKNDFENLGMSEIARVSEEFDQERISDRNAAKVEIIREKVKSDRESIINQQLLDSCISFRESHASELHSSIDSDDLIDSPQKRMETVTYQSSCKSEGNDSFDSVSEHFQNLSRGKKLVKQLKKRDGSVNPMSKTLSRNDAELLFREKTLSRCFSFSGALSAFSVKRRQRTLYKNGDDRK